MKEDEDNPIKTLHSDSSEEEDIIDDCLVRANGSIVHIYAAKYFKLDFLQDDELFLYFASNIDHVLEKLSLLSSQPIGEVRPVNTRFIGTCYHFSLLSQYLLEQKGIKSTVRAGFATYIPIDGLLPRKDTFQLHYVLEFEDGTRRDAQYCDYEVKLCKLDIVPYKLVPPAYFFTPDEFIVEMNIYIDRCIKKEIVKSGNEITCSELIALQDKYREYFLDRIALGRPITAEECLEELIEIDKQCSHIIGLIRTPLDGLQHRTLGIVAHCGEISSLSVCKSDLDGSVFVVSSGKKDACVNLWKVNVEAFNKSIALNSVDVFGGRELNPFVQMLDEAGESGEYYQRVREFFRYTQTLQEPLDGKHRVKGEVSCCSLRKLCSVLGVFLTDQEEYMLKREVIVSFQRALLRRKIIELTQEKVGMSVRTRPPTSGLSEVDIRIDLDEFIRVFVNHRSTSSPSNEEIVRRMIDLGAENTTGVFDRATFLSLLESEGDKLSKEDQYRPADTDIRESLKLTADDVDAIVGEKMTGDGGTFTIGHFINNILRLEEEMDKVGGLDDEYME
ncbi:hypothetical protein ADUPG1_012839 [Aduncisulcus paluster]|uniref:Uncharacterized protein n=1 Tax=Aduncisulcus paluster TaxID=2918883 RepID=A0ABQ5K4I9_9EUKA|nr:hypothetical protein ADUPG1_012839 [Aduncisulcus paluster]